ncbi:MAG TPA: NAD(P)/FAD-dependent oxidoreductase [Caulobacteraceae bacterium]|nr:NAD(P)/FAD-dependent oxidoreductase [Caulobacteraceae bacterium]
MAPRRKTTAAPDVDVLIVGAGFSGLGLAVRLKTAGRERFLIIEKGDDVGGTWRDNTYPGCACDIPSHLYSLSFEPKSDWTRLYPPQPELFDYLQKVARKHGLYEHIRLKTRMEKAAWDEAAGLWRVTTGQGDEITAKVLVSGVGALHIPSIPKLKGIEKFKGAAFHSAQWRHDVDLTGKRVAVIGTGASAIQFVPQIAPQVEKLTLFQRTAPWVLPKIDGPIGPIQQFLFRHVPGYRVAFRALIYWINEARALALVNNSRMIRIGEWYARRFIAKHIPDPALRAKVTPSYKMGCKRVLLANDYYPALARPNVEVVIDGVAEVKANSIVGQDGVERPVDAIIYGTGFDVTDSLKHLPITGRNGLAITDAWKDGVRGYYGITVSGFPNYFMLLGPNTGLGHNSQIVMIEAQINYVMSALEKLDAGKIRALDLKPQVLEVHDRQIQDKLKASVWQQGGCMSWYQDATGRNVTLWPGFTFDYVKQTKAVNLDEYEAA